MEKERAIKTLVEAIKQLQDVHEGSLFRDYFTIRQSVDIDEALEILDTGHIAGNAPPIPLPSIPSCDSCE